MANSCEIIHRGVDKKGRRLPRLRSFGTIPLLHTSRLPACLQKPVELSLAMVTARAEILSTLQSKMEGIYTWQPKNPGNLALKIAVGTLGFGAVATAVTYYYVSLAERQIAETQAIIQGLAK